MTEAICFDLFMTLMDFPLYPMGCETEFSVLGLSRDEWYRRDEATYEERATGRIRDPYEAMRFILKDRNYSDIQIRRATDLRIERIAASAQGIDESVWGTLESIKERGIRIGIVSNVDIIDLMGIRASRLEEIFDAVVFSYETGTMKPEQGIYEEAVKRMKMLPETTLYVGDGGHKELWGAKRCGMTTVLTTEYIRKHWPEQISNLSKDADIVIDTIHKVLRYIEEEAS